MGRTLRIVWEAWKSVARKISNFQARILLTLFYFLIVLPFALALRWISDPLAIKPRTPRGWRPKVSEATDLESARRQY
jgi:hypothetical protein